MHTRGALFLPIAGLLASCAGPTQLARLSGDHLRAGDVEAAYTAAHRAISIDPDHAAARRAFAEAAIQRADAWKARVLDRAIADTVAAAEEALAFLAFREELGPYPVELPADSGFAVRERGVREAGAAIEARHAEAALAAGRPREAHGRMTRAAGFVPESDDYRRRAAAAHERALTRVAILPPANDTDLRDLSRAAADDWIATVARRIRRDGFAYTEIVEPAEIYASLTVAELEGVTRESGARVARGVEAGRFVVGRVHALRVDSDSRSFDYPVFRHVATRDTAGRPLDVYEERRFAAVARLRRVTLRVDLDLVDARTLAVLARRSEPLEIAARVVWSDFAAEGDCDDYCLVPPGPHGAVVTSPDAVRDRWASCFGSWTLPQLLERTRRERHRDRYVSAYAGEFQPEMPSPVVLAELPDERDLVRIALDRAWEPLLAMLREADARD